MYFQQGEFILHQTCQLFFSTRISHLLQKCNFLDAGIEIAQDLTPNPMEITGAVTSRLKTWRCGIWFGGVVTKLRLFRKKMAAKIPLTIKWSGVNTAENVGQGTMGNAPNHTENCILQRGICNNPTLKIKIHVHTNK